MDDVSIRLGGAGSVSQIYTLLQVVVQRYKLLI